VGVDGVEEGLWDEESLWEFCVRSLVVGGLWDEELRFVDGGTVHALV
jgi:hypothetical protein